MCGSPHNVKVMYDLKRNKVGCTFRSNNRKFCWQSQKVKWDGFTRKLKKMCGSRHMEKDSTHPEEREKSVYRQSATFAIFTINTSEIVLQTETILQTGKVQTGRNSLKFTKTTRGSKVSYQKKLSLNR